MTMSFMAKRYCQLPNGYLNICYHTWKRVLPDLKRGYYPGRWQFMPITEQCCGIEKYFFGAGALTKRILFFKSRSEMLSPYTPNLSKPKAGQLKQNILAYASLILRNKTFPFPRTCSIFHPWRQNHHSRKKYLSDTWSYRSLT
jgi:hypothetical protein